MSDYKDIVFALRCSSRTPVQCKEDCPYRTLEKITPDFHVRADITIDGIDYYESCDVDRMAVEAADAIERLSKELAEKCAREKK